MLLPLWLFGLQFCRIDVSYCGRCYYHWLADVIAIVYVLLYCVADVATTADGIAILWD